MVTSPPPSSAWWRVRSSRARIAYSPLAEILIPGREWSLQAAFRPVYGDLTSGPATTSLPAQARVQGVLEAVAQEVEAEHHGEDGQAREGGHPPVLELGLPGGDHRPPLGSRRDRAEP